MTTKQDMAAQDAEYAEGWGIDPTITPKKPDGEFAEAFNELTAEGAQEGAADAVANADEGTGAKKVAAEVPPVDAAVPVKPAAAKLPDDEEAK
jgi:hypothetical protein